MEPVYTPVIWVARALFAAQGLKFTISGAENIPTSGGAVLVSNHPELPRLCLCRPRGDPQQASGAVHGKDDVFAHKVSGPLLRWHAPHPGGPERRRRHHFGQRSTR
jgi:hypothetical protein